MTKLKHQPLQAETPKVYEPFYLADYIIHYQKRYNQSITPFKLQTLVYLLAAMYMQANGHHLIKEPFYHRLNHPVIKPIYKTYTNQNHGQAKIKHYFNVTLNQGWLNDALQQLNQYANWALIDWIKSEPQYQNRHYNQAYDLNQTVQYLNEHPLSQLELNPVDLRAAPVKNFHYTLNQRYVLCYYHKYSKKYLVGIVIHDSNSGMLQFLTVEDPEKLQSIDRLFNPDLYQKKIVQFQKQFNSRTDLNVLRRPEYLYDVLNQMQQENPYRFESIREIDAPNQSWLALTQKLVKENE